MSYGCIMDKSHRYQNVLNTSCAVLQDYPMDIIGRMSIISSILKTEFSEWIFCGFYRVVKPNILEIGPSVALLSLSNKIASKNPSLIAFSLNSRFDK